MFFTHCRMLVISTIGIVLTANCLANDEIPTVDTGVIARETTEALEELEISGTSDDSTSSGSPAAGSDESLADEDSGVSVQEATEVLDELEVSATPGATTPLKKRTLEGEDLRRNIRSTLGETLESTPGIHNASFGPGVGLPVMRGLSGARVHVMQHGLGTHDASAVSPDHALTVEPLLADRIEIEQGPAVIRYGNRAMGGAINVHDGRIAKWLPLESFSGSIEQRHLSNPNQDATVFRLEQALDPLVIHLSGFRRSSDVVRIPGGALDEDAIRQQFGEAIEFTNSQGSVPNTETDARSGTVGVSLVGLAGFIGVAWNTLENNYGIPPGGHPAHTHGSGPPTEQVSIEMEQQRYELSGGVYDWFEWLPELSLDIASTRYVHDEMEVSTTATTFENDTTEGRIEANLALLPAGNTTLGYNWQQRTFSALGLETFVPLSDISANATYWIQHIDLYPLSIELGLRQEWSQIKPADSFRTVGLITVPLPDELQHQSSSWSLQLGYEVPDSGLQLSATLSRSQRSPEVQELLSLGPHLSTRSFDIGNIALDVERTRSIELDLDWRGELLFARTSLFHYDIDNYIYQENQGFKYHIEKDTFQLNCASLDACVDVFGYQQRDARFSGFEMELGLDDDISGLGQLRLSVFADYVRARFTLEAAGDVPRQPPMRFGAAASLGHGNWQHNLRWTRALAQNNPGLNETETADWQRLDFDTSLELTDVRGTSLNLFVQGRNLLNAEIRHSTSFLRNFTPEAGRSMTAGIRWAF